MIVLIIPGRPVPAVRMTRGGKFVREDRARTPAAAARARRIERHLAYRDEVAWRARAAKLPLLTGPVCLTTRFYVHGGQVADLGNYVKLAEDGLKGIAWRDDRQVVRYGAGTGIYRVETAAEERAEIVIEEAAEVSA